MYNNTCEFSVINNIMSNIITDGVSYFDRRFACARIRDAMRISMRIGVAHDFCTNSAVWRIGHISIGTERCRQPTNVSLPTELLDRAKQPDINISRASERNLREEVHEAEAHAWAAQHADFIAELNAFCSPYMNILRHDNPMNFDSKSP
jgi:post-segregation antitoxin (ccd killing protein)